MLFSKFIWAVAVGIAYFAGARLGLALLAQPEGVAVFWPASGVAAGTLLVLGRDRCAAVATGVFIATITANLLGDRNAAMAVAFGLCNAGEVLLFAWCIWRFSGPTFGFTNLTEGLWFVVAAASSTAISAAAASLTIALIGQSSTPLLNIWEAWWQSDAIGILTLAPFIVAVGQFDNKPRAWREGAVAVVVLVAITGFTYFAQPDQAAWQVPIPVAVIFPVMLWMAARTAPEFLTVGLVIVTLMIVWATTNSLGHFGNPGVPLPDRILAARVTLLSIASCAFVLIAVFNERQAVENKLRASERQFRNLAAISPVGIYRTGVDGKCIYVNARCLQITGMTEGQALGPSWSAAMHPDDVQLILSRWRYAVENRQPIAAEYRFRTPDGHVVWVFDQAIAEHDDSGAPRGYVGTITDVTERKRSEERVELLIGEVNHRAKNLLSVAQAVAFHTAREEVPGDFVETFNKRLASLATSHDLLSLSAWEGVNASDLAHRQLAHFRDLFGNRIIIEGPSLGLKPAAAQAIGMALHELSTNAAKYGALSKAEGTVHIKWWIGDRFQMSWTEAGGPPVNEPTRRGFGHDVMVEMATHELDATVQLKFPPSGLVWELSAPIERTIEIGQAQKPDTAPCAY